MGQIQMLQLDSKQCLVIDGISWSGYKKLFWPKFKLLLLDIAAIVNYHIKTTFRPGMTNISIFCECPQISFPLQKWYN